MFRLQSPSEEDGTVVVEPESTLISSVNEGVGDCGGGGGTDLGRNRLVVADN